MAGRSLCAPPPVPPQSSAALRGIHTICWLSARALTGVKRIHQTIPLLSSEARFAGYCPPHPAIQTRIEAMKTRTVKRVITDPSLLVLTAMEGVLPSCHMPFLRSSSIKLLTQSIPTPLRHSRLEPMRMYSVHLTRPISQQGDVAASHLPHLQSPRPPSLGRSTRPLRTHGFAITDI